MNGYFNRLTMGLLAATASGIAMVPSAQAQDAEAAVEEWQGGLGDIVVTARRRAERAQETPISLSVATGETLANRSVQTFIDVQRQTPSLHILPSALSATATNLSMRGQGVQDIRLNIDPGVAIYVDGVLLPRAQGSNAADMIDIDRVEVLAGPQGTLYGKNTTGGAVAIYSKDPVQETEGFIRGRMGSYLDSNIAGMLNVPVSETVAFRALASYSHRDGYGRNRETGAKTGKLDSYYTRAALKFESDALAVTLRGDYTHAKVIREAYKGFAFLGPVDPATGAAPAATIEAALEMRGIPSMADFLALPLATRVGYLTEADALLRRYSGGDPDDAASDIDSFEKIKIWGASAQIDYQLTDNLSFKSITAWRGFNRKGAQDLDGTPFEIIQYPYQKTVDHQFSQEAQLAFSGMDSRLNLITGIYYADEDGTERIDQTSVSIISTPVAATSVSSARVENKSIGAFAQGSFRFTNALSATAGIRYSKDDRKLNASNYNAVLCTSLGVPLASIGGIENCQRPMSVSFDKVSYTGSIEFRPVTDVMIYAKTSRGYRSGGLQQANAGVTPELADAAFLPFRPEIATDYELGFKSELWDRRLRVNVTYYHTDLKDAIRNVSVPVEGQTRPASLAQNAADVKIDGVEFDIMAAPVDGLELALNGAWTDARFSRYVTPTGEDRSHIPLVFTPEWQIGASIAYTARLGWGDWRNQVDMSYTAKQLTAETEAYSPAHTLFNARSSLEIHEADLNIAFFVKNLTNKRYIQYPVDVRAGLGFTYASLYNPPRTIGLEFMKRF